jgi:AmmeMemoRadiSam system protein B
MGEHIPIDLRPSPIAGKWYPGKRDELANMIDRFVEAAQIEKIEGAISGLVVPHAGYIYSGRIAAAAFKLVQGQAFNKVVVISPMHSYYSDPILTSAHEAYWTPLGNVPVDRNALNELGKHLPLRAVRDDPEHALEIELPFLQHLLSGSFELIPLMLADQSYEIATAIGHALATILKNESRILLVASSDLSHFYTDDQARRLDQIMLDRVAACDPEGVIRVESEGRAFACGRGAVAAVLVACKVLGASDAKIAAYATSAEVNGDTSRVVGYGAAAIFNRILNRAQGDSSD